MINNEINYSLETADVMQHLIKIGEFDNKDIINLHLVSKKIKEVIKNQLFIFLTTFSFSARSFIKENQTPKHANKTSVNLYGNIIKKSARNTKNNCDQITSMDKAKAENLYNAIIKKSSIENDVFMNLLHKNNFTDKSLSIVTKMLRNK